MPGDPRADAMRICTCLGSCVGRAGLAPGWRCAMDLGCGPSELPQADPANKRRKPPMLALPEYDLDTLQRLSDGAFDWGDLARTDALRRLTTLGFVQFHSDYLTDAGRVLLNYALGADQAEAHLAAVTGERDAARAILTRCWDASGLLCADMTGKPGQAWEEAADLVAQIEENASAAELLREAEDERDRLRDAAKEAIRGFCAADGPIARANVVESLEAAIEGTRDGKEMDGA